MTARQPSLLTSSQIDKHYPVIIIGGGPAGVSALLGFLEAKITALLINNEERMGGQLASIPSPIENFALGTFINGAAAAEALNLNLSKQGLIFKAEVKALEIRSPLRLLVSSEEQPFALTCDYLIIATGNLIRFKPLKGDACLEKHGFLPDGEVVVGITAGASTPDQVVAEVLEKLFALRS